LSALPDFGAACAVPFQDYERVVLGHGSGGRLSHELLARVILPALGRDPSEPLEDQATLPPIEGRGAITTDAFVIQPLFFPGGDIGSLAVHGTINDLAVGGARPLHLTAALILEEGLPLSVLSRIVQSMRSACEVSGVALVAGDTKVVERGKADGLYVTTTGLGSIAPELALSVTKARPGDRVIVSGTLGDHGIAVLAQREGIELQTELVSDSAPLWGLVERMLATSAEVRCMRDPTRGGASSALNEIAAASRVGIVLDEARIPVREAVVGACELLGFDPLYVANEGKLIAIVPPASAEHVLQAMQAHPLGRDAAILGEVVADHPGTVVLRSRLGGKRIVAMLSGDQLPRIC
jgi:hydrogenase expression/formation protein HypE